MEGPRPPSDDDSGPLPVRLAPPPSDASDDIVGLENGPVLMPQIIAMPHVTANSGDDAFAEIEKDGCHWKVVNGHRGLVERSPIDWFALENWPGAKLGKSNSQRDVWQVDADGQSYFVKVYHPNGAPARVKLLLRGPIALEEWNVGRYAAAHDISAVRPVACAWNGPRGWTGPSLLITEAVTDAMPLNDFWAEHRADRHLSDVLIESLARLIARAHQCGFRHGDMHPGNILVRRQRLEQSPPQSRGGKAGSARAALSGCAIFFVDLHRVQIGRSVSMRDIVANLAQLNQWFRRNASRTQRVRFLSHYLRFRDAFAQASPHARNWRIDPRTLSADLARQAAAHAEKLWAKRDRRSNRSGRYFDHIRPARGWSGIALLQCKHPAAAGVASKLTYSSNDWNRWLADPLSWVDPSRHVLLKDSHTATICRARLPADPLPASVIVKRSLSRNLWKRILHLLGPSRNRRAWRMANKLMNRDLPTAQPLAVIERRVLGLFCADSLIFTEDLVGSIDLEAFLTRHVAGLPQIEQRVAKDRLIGALVALLKAFHERGFAHRDLKAPNILVNWPTPGIGRPALTLIDMEGISRVRGASRTQIVRAIARLAASLLASPACSRSDRLRFMIRYLTGPGRTAWDWKGYWRETAAWSDSKVQQKQHRRSWKLKHYGRE